MSAPILHGIQSSAFLPSIYTDPELYHELRTAHIFFVDNYEKIYKRYGITRDEMMTVMCDLTKVDPLVGTEILPYLPIEE